MCIPQIETHGWWQTHSHTFLASPVCSPDSMWSSDRTALPPLVRSCLKDQSGEVIQTGMGGREDFSPFMMLQSPVRKTLCLCSSIRTNVASKCCWRLRLLPCCCFFLHFSPFAPNLIPVNFLSGNFYPAPSLSSQPHYKTHLGISMILSRTWSSSSCLRCAAVSPPRLPPSHFLCLCLTAGVFLKNNKLWGCVCACVLRWLHRLDGLATLGWLLVWSPGKLYDLFS